MSTTPLVYFFIRTVGPSPFKQTEIFFLQTIFLAVLKKFLFLIPPQILKEDVLNFLSFNRHKALF